MKKATLFIISLLALSIVGCSTPLHQAARNGDTGAVVALLDSGKFDINERWQNWPPLLYASSYGHVDTVRLLLDRGAGIDARHTGRSALTLAALNGHADVARLLIERGADIDAAMAGLETFGSSEAKPGISLLVRLAQHKNKSGQPMATKSSSDRSDPSSIKSSIDEIPTIENEPRRNAFAVVIGIENYRNLPKSDYSVKDAALVKAYLKALGFQERNIDFVTDGDTFC